MEILFENVHVRDKQTYKEIFTRTILRRPFFIVLDIIMAFELLFIIVNCLIDRYFDIKIIFLYVLYLFFRIFPYFNSIRISLKRDEELSRGNPMHLITTVTEDTVTLTNGQGNVSQFPLSAVKVATQTKSFILLKTKAKYLLIFKKDGFTKGSYADFWHFLQYKGIPVK